MAYPIDEDKFVKSSTSEFGHDIENSWQRTIYKKEAIRSVYVNYLSLFFFKTIKFH